MSIRLLAPFIFAFSILSASEIPKEAPKRISLSADALYWFPTETIDWAIVIRKNQNVQSATYQTIDFDWSPGFRVGLGYKMKHDEWNTNFTYTYFHAKTTMRAHGGDSGVVQSAFLGPKVSIVGTFLSAKIHLNLDYHIFDWDLGRKVLVSDYLSLRPFIGVKGGWINQTLRSKWDKSIDILDLLIFPFSASENVKNDFAGAGPKGGVNGMWTFAKTKYGLFSLFGDFTAAYLWGHWDIKDKYQDSLFTTVFIKTRDRNLGALILQSYMGFGYDRNRLSLKLGYEIEDWFNQYQVFDNGTGGHSNALLLQGLTFKIKADF